MSEALRLVPNSGDGLEGSDIALSSTSGDNSLMLYEHEINCGEFP